MTIDRLVYIQNILVESMWNIAGNMTELIKTLSEYDTDDVDHVPVKNFVEEAESKIGEAESMVRGFIDDMQTLASKYLEIGVKKAEKAKEEIGNEVCVSRWQEILEFGASVIENTEI